jgi:peptidoglycan LD-endopeptidase LytH
MDHTRIRDYFLTHPEKVGKVVDFTKGHDQLLDFDFTDRNNSLSADIIADTAAFSSWVENQLAAANCRYGIGGYIELRTLYARKSHFDSGEEPRCLHLGTDIWGPVGTPVYCPVDGRVHSFRYNDNFGDYGATIILEHDLDGYLLHTLYGHLDLASLSLLETGQFIPKGHLLARFGDTEENGFWPPHLHFQLILDMGSYSGDYPGVCRFSERRKFMQNCPDPLIILHANFN